jgi:hypothetical protein
MGLDQKRFFESGRRAERENLIDALTWWAVGQDNDDCRVLLEEVIGWLKKLD